MNGAKSPLHASSVMHSWPNPHATKTGGGGGGGTVVVGGGGGGAVVVGGGGGGAVVVGGGGGGAVVTSALKKDKLDEHKKILRERRNSPTGTCVDCSVGRLNGGYGAG